MPPRITIAVQDLKGSTEDVQQELASAAGGAVTIYGATRGGVGDIVNFIVELSGPATQIAEKLLDVAKSAMAGSEMTVKAQGMEVSLKNVPRDRLVEVLQMVMDTSSQK